LNILKKGRKKMKTAAVALAVFFSILVLGCGEDIISPNTGPSYQEPLARGLSAEPFATWSPAGDKILFCQKGNIWVMDGEGSSLEKLIIFPDENKKASRPDWNGDRIIFQLNYPESNRSEIYSQRAFSGMAEKIDFGLPEGSYQFPARSPDGNSIVFTFNDRMYLSEYPPKGIATLINVGEKINKDCQWIGMYSWSSDGRIAFVAKTSEGTNIFVMEDLQTRAVIRITEGNVRDYNPSWSHNGLYLAFDSNRFTIAGEYNICLIKSDGSDLKQLTKESGAYPKFHPGNYDLLYSSKMVEGWRINLLHKAI